MHGFRQFVPPRMIGAYDKARLAVDLARNLKTASAAGLMDSLRFSRTILKVKERSLLNLRYLESLHFVARAVDEQGVEGDFVECGVYHGGSAALLGAELRRSAVSRSLWL